jgi:hypothetical protein
MAKQGDYIDEFDSARARIASGTTASTLATYEINTGALDNNALLYTCPSTAGADSRPVKSARIDRVRVTVYGTQTGCLARLWLRKAGGTLIELTHEQVLANTTVSATVASAFMEHAPPGGIILKAGDELYFGRTSVTNGVGAVIDQLGICTEQAPQKAV